MFPACQALAKAIGVEKASSGTVVVLPGTKEMALGVVQRIAKGWGFERRFIEGKEIFVYTSLDGRYSINLRTIASEYLKAPFNTTIKPNATIDVMNLNAAGKVIQSWEIKFGSL